MTEPSNDLSQLKRWQHVANQGIQIEIELRTKIVMMERIINNLLHQLDGVPVGNPQQARERREAHELLSVSPVKDEAGVPIYGDPKE